MKEQGIKFWANVASRMTKQAANAKDWMLKRKSDKRMKEIAQELSAGCGYIIATDKELESQYPGLFKSQSVDESKKMIWAVDFQRYNHFAKMSFAPIR